VSVLDACVMFASFVVAYIVRGRIGGLAPFHEYLWISAIVVPIWIVLARTTGLTASHTYRQLSGAITVTLKVHLIASLILLSGLYLLKAVEISRLLMQTFLVISAAAMVIERMAIHAAIVRFADKWSEGTRRLLVVGPAAAADALQRLLRQQPHWGASIVGVVTDESISPTRGAVPVLGRLMDLGRLFDTMVFDEVVMADPRVERELGERVMSDCVERGLSYHTLVVMPAQVAARHHAEVLGEGVYLLSLETTPQNFAALAVKRGIDLVGATVGLLGCALAYIVFAPLIHFGSAGPVIFRQVRIGRNGRRFTVYKFRTMRPDAEAELAGLQDANEMSGHLFKLRDDPRVTPIGRFLRRTYLDELPQFWNVLKGEMSLVGTRPPTPDEVANYAPHHRRRLSVRPGITGLWQCHGNGRVSDFEMVVQLDCEYIDRWSLWLDMQILARTCLTVIRLSGH
jgi:exopolysaccharide biosynthesis polyprenyl glycosylphosphotransferase